MIRINLLPVELRRGTAISAKLLITMVASCLLVCAAVGWFGLVYFGDLGEVEGEEREMATQLTDKTRKGAYYDKLEANLKDYTNRVQTITDIGKSRRLWSKFCDELIDVVNNNNDIERHLGWFDSLTIKTDPKKGATVKLPGAVQGGEMFRVANLHEDLEAAPFVKDLIAKSQPGGKIDLDKTRTPAESFRFDLSMQFAPTVIEAKPVKKDKKAAEPKK